MSNIREACERIIHLASQISALGRSLRDHSGSDADTEGLRPYYERLKAEIAKLDAFVTHSCGLETSCHILASNLLLRIELTERKAQYSDGFLDRIWSDDSLKALDDQIGELSNGLARMHGSDSADRSRSLWTSGEQVSPRADLTHDGAQRLASLPAGDDDDENEDEEDLAADIQATLRNVDTTEMLQEFFIESLAFPSMNDREVEVSEAHHRTFEWIFESNGPGLDVGKRPQDTSTFVSWLATLNCGQLYWINGKAGSGKSTLLRFLARNVKTRKALQQWAGSSELIILSFFFWTGGTSMQRSEAGLLRSLLHQLLSQRREMIPWTFSKLWLACQDTKTRVKMVLTWEVPELVRAFRIALRLVAKHAKICLFIDGLDEFDGNQATVISLVRSIVNNSSNVKVCVSSRPWAAFEEAFGRVPHMLLQDLTDADMELYVRDQFLSSAETTQIAHDSNFGLLYAEIRRQANGVFLWTNLALQHVLANVEHGINLDAFRATISILPSDLEDLFRYLLFTDRSEMALAEQSCLLRIIKARDEVCDFTGDDEARAMPLYQLLLAFEGRTADIAAPIRRCAQEATLIRCNNMAEVLHDRCAGLIVLSAEDERHIRTHVRARTVRGELQESANRRVHYLHRTVRDFLVLTYPDAPPEPVAHQALDADPHVRLLQSHVLRLRSPLEEPEQHRRLDEWWHDDIVPALTHARIAPVSTREIQTTILDSLNDTLHSLWRKRNDRFGKGDPLDTWACHAFGTYELRNKHKTPFHHPFLSLAAKFGLAEYLRVKLTSHPEEFRYHAGVPLLSHALEMLISRRKSVYPLSSPTVIEVLLESEEDPNLRYKNMFAQEETPWLAALKYVREGKRRGWMAPFDVNPEGCKRWAEILKLMLGSGADPKAIILKDKWDPEVTALEVVTNVAETYFDADVWEIKSSLETKQ